MTLWERFWSKVDATGDCWLWTGYVQHNGYGQFCVKRGNNQMAHRISAAFVGRFPTDDLQVDHRCRVRRCVNPDHLQYVTPKVNVNRGIRPKTYQTHCVNGHEFTDENTAHWPSKRGKRCRICSRASKNRSYARITSP